jgi:hypothetical protein
MLSSQTKAVRDFSFTSLKNAAASKGNALLSLVQMKRLFDDRRGTIRLSEPSGLGEEDDGESNWFRGKESSAGVVVVTVSMIDE